VKSADVLFTTGKAKVVYDPDVVGVDRMLAVVRELGYTVKGTKE